MKKATRIKGLIALLVLGTVSMIVLFRPDGTTPKKTDYLSKTRHQRWVADIDFFESQYLPESKTFSKEAISDCKILLNRLRTEIDSLDDSELILELSKCVAMANNGHTTIHLSGMKKIPIRFYWFSDGLHIIKTATAFSGFLGSKVLAIDSVAVDSVLARLNPYLAGIDRFKKFTAMNYLSSPEILHGVGISKKDSLTLTLLKDKDTVSVRFGVKEMQNSTYEYETWSDLYPDTEGGWSHLKEKDEPLPLYLKQMPEGVFYKLSETNKIAYFSINALWYRCEDFEEKIEAFLESLKMTTDYDVVIDLRYYTGGNFLIPTELATEPPKIIDDDKKIYLITSNMTFSAGLVTAARIKYFAEDKIVIVGEKVGDNLKFWAEGVYYTLPYSGVEIQDSKYEHDWENDTFTLGKTFWVNAFYGVPAKNLKLDKEIQLSFQDYLNNRDPILDWVFEEK